jgi:pseudouridine synthase
MTPERLQKILSRAGITSRRKAERLVHEGRIQVNGTVVRQLDFKADPVNDHIRVDGKMIKRLEPKVYVVLNKPRGVLCTRMDPSGRPVVTDLIKRVKCRLYPAGRLDADSEGLVILTNDGEFFQHLAHPKHQKPRTYLVKVKGMPDAKAIQLLRHGVNLSDGMTQRAQVKLVRLLKVNSWWKVVVREGRNRLVRRMFQQIHHPVVRLVRVKYGPLELGGLNRGQYRHLNRHEVDSLMKSTGGLKFAARKRTFHSTMPNTNG